MNAPVDTLPVYGTREPHITQYGTSLVLSSSTAPVRSYGRSRQGRTDTRHDLGADFWTINAYVDCLDPGLAPARLTYAWPSARLLDSLGVCLRMTSTERTATSAAATPTTR